MQAVFATWQSSFVAIFAVVTCITAFAEFLGGPELQRKWQETIYNWWDRVSSIPIPKLGIEEARFANRAISAVFGDRPFGIRRIATALSLSVLWLVAMSTLMMTPTFDGHLFVSSPLGPNTYRNAAGLYWSVVLHFVVSHFLLLAVQIWISVFVTQWIIDFAIRRIGKSRRPLLVFIVVLIGSVIGSFSSLVTISFGIDFLAFFAKRSLAETFAMYDRANMISEYLFVGFLVQTYRVFIGYRLMIAVAFIAWWGSAYLIRFIQLILRRLFEGTKGATTIFAGLLTSIATFWDWIST